LHVRRKRRKRCPHCSDPVHVLIILRFPKEHPIFSIRSGSFWQ
jgi:hypothetical protein